MVGNGEENRKDSTESASVHDIGRRKAPVSQARLRQRLRLSLRRKRRENAAKPGGRRVVLLDRHEAAEYLGISLGSLRMELQGDDGWWYLPGMIVFDLNELRRHLLSFATSVEELKQAALRHLRWQARDFELYPLPCRTVLVEEFTRASNDLLPGFAADGDDDGLAAVQAIVRQARRRLREDTIAN